MFGMRKKHMALHIGIFEFESNRMLHHWNFSKQKGNILLVWRRHAKIKYKMMKTSAVHKCNILDIGVEENDREKLYFSSVEQDSAESRIHVQMLS